MRNWFGEFEKAVACERDREDLGPEQLGFCRQVTTTGDQHREDGKGGMMATGHRIQEESNLYEFRRMSECGDLNRFAYSRTSKYLVHTW